MAAHHHHDHTHSIPANFNRIFVLAISLNFIFALIEALYALHASSMSLLADAGHNFGDVLGLIVAGISNWLLVRSPTERYSYGYKKMTILSALINALLLLVTSVLILSEAIDKLFHPTVINEKVIIIVASLGVLINTSTALLFLKGSKHDLNLKSAYWHLAADALIAVGVVITGIILYYTHWWLLDPTVSILIVLAILWGTWRLLQDSINLILGAVPHTINQLAVRQYLAQLPGVESVHDLHIWALSTRETALTAHLIMPSQILTDEDYTKINHHLIHEFKINHVTLQVERGQGENPCGQALTC
jgi:cobalt-zinc-cadmium efflux system protein